MKKQISLYLVLLLILCAPTTTAERLPPAFSIVESTFSEKALDAGKTGTLSISITNNGLGDADLHIKLKSKLKDKGLSFDPSTDAIIPKGTTDHEVEIDIKSDLSLPTTAASIDIVVTDKHFKMESQDKINFDTRKFELLVENPEVVEFKSGTPNDKIDPGDTIQLKFSVSNKGAVPVDEVKIQVQYDTKNTQLVGIPSNTNDQLLKDEEDQLLKELPPLPKIDVGGSEAISFLYLVKSDSTNTKVQFKVTVNTTWDGKKYSWDKKVSTNTNGGIVAIFVLLICFSLFIVFAMKKGWKIHLRRISDFLFSIPISSISIRIPIIGYVLSRERTVIIILIVALAVIAILMFIFFIIMT